MRLLVIDDDKGISNFLKLSLGAEGFEVDIATDGEQGSYYANTNEYDLMIIDYCLPKKDGKEICQELRKNGKTTPILMLSVKSEPHTKADLLNTGADDYLTKPFSLEELLARTRALLRRPTNIQEEILNVDDLELDVKKHTVKRGDKEIYLTLKELFLLEYLMKHPGIVLSRGMILEHVWDMNADPFSNTIEVHISNLRRKIDLPGKKKLICTVPGRGYKIAI